MIFLGGLKGRTRTDLVESIKLFKDDLSESVIKQCLDALPNEKELRQISSLYSENLRAAESFMLELSNISRCKQKLEVMLFKTNFNEIHTTLKVDLTTACNAFRCILKSEQLPILLEIILAVGNYINGTPSKGFKISFLEKIMDVKGQNKTGLQLIGQFIRETYPRVFQVFVVGLYCRFLKSSSP